MKKIVNENKLNTLIDNIKVDFEFAIQNVEYRKNVINLLKSSIESNIEKHKQCDNIDSHAEISDFIQIDPNYNLTYVIYNDVEIIRDNSGYIKQINYIPYAGTVSFGKYRDNFYNRYSLCEDSFMVINYKYIPRKHKVIES